MNSTLRIATRQSPLALWQAEHVKQRLQQYWPALDIQLLPMTTSGDQFLKDTLAAVGGKGLFVKELERALQDGRADLAVHSLKDVPAHLPEGLILSTFLQREDPRDALVSPYSSLSALPKDAVLGTASLRRQAIVQHYYPHVRVETLRGNVNSRLEKLAAGHFDAILLAAAGLKRLSFEGKISQMLDIETFIPAVGQGVLALECRANDQAVQDLLKPLHHGATAACVVAERACNLRLGGACHVPVAAHAVLHHDQLHLTALVASPNGQDFLSHKDSAPVSLAETLGISVAEHLLSRGAAAILQAL